MSDFKYRFMVSLGFPGADREEEFDLVDDFDYDEESLKKMSASELTSLVDNEVEDWHHEYVEYWAERV